MFYEFESFICKTYTFAVLSKGIWYKVSPLKFNSNRLQAMIIFMRMKLNKNFHEMFGLTLTTPAGYHV